MVNIDDLEAEGIMDQLFESPICSDAWNNALARLATHLRQTMNGDLGRAVPSGSLQPGSTEAGHHLASDNAAHDFETAQFAQFLHDTYCERRAVPRAHPMVQMGGDMDRSSTADTRRNRYIEIFNHAVHASCDGISRDLGDGRHARLQRHIRWVDKQIRRAVSLQRMKAEYSRHAAVCHSIARDPGKTVCVVNRQGRVRFQAGAANRFMHGHMLSVHTGDGRIRFHYAEDQRRFHHRLADATATPYQASSMVLLDRRKVGLNERLDMQLTINPIQLSYVECLAEEATALVIMSLISLKRDSEAERLRSLLRLTHAQSDLASRLLAGANLQDCAADLNVSLSTVKSHLKALMLKTGTHRQAELVAFLARVS